MRRPFFLLHLSALLFAGAAPSSAQTFVPAPMPALLRKAGLPPTVRFGYVTVPANRAMINGQKIQIAVAILPARESPKKPDPIFFLQGGPGGAATLVAGDPVYSLLSRDRDVVFIDQRGCGFSRPFLGAASNDVTVPFRPIARARARFRERGIPLASFNTPENAADVEAVRKALGYGQINLLGSSYGTVLAQQVMSDFPHRLRSVVLSGVVPLRGWDLVPGNQLVQMDGLRGLFRDVRRTRRDRRSFPALSSRYNEVIARLLERPVILRHRRQKIRLDAFSFQSALIVLLQTPQTVRYVPLLIEAAWEGRYEQVGPYLYPPMRPGDRGLAFGMFLSVVSHDFRAPGTHRHALAQVDRLPNGPFKTMTRYTVDRLTKALDRWPVAYDPGAIRPPFGSAVPTLLVQGDMDAQTPPKGGTDAARLLGLKNAFVMSFPRSGHATGLSEGPACDAIRQFFDTPNRRPVVNLAPLRKRHFYLTKFPQRSRTKAMHPVVPVASLP